MIRPAIGVLVSGRGSNLQALFDAIESGVLDARIAVVVSDQPSAPALARATAAGVATAVVERRAFASRDAFDRAIAGILRQHEVVLVCLAGFMRLLGAGFVAEFPNAILNIHPSLLPSFPGLDAQRQALEHGVRVSGATVHIVTAELDAGPIVAQAAVPVLDEDTVETLAARILVEEHRIYPAAVRAWLAGGWRIEGRRFVHATTADEMASSRS
ncbi:MAG: phosphoribosylglycinamide formyltransferase [Vicinamibacteraceae bacterium]|nr:phosphoribosylglycinamide formyltransferase [Vicinamibacteraceae bacterium]